MSLDVLQSAGPGARASASAAPVDHARIRALRHEEAVFQARIDSLTRKLEAGTTLVTHEDLQHCQRELARVQAALVEAGAAAADAAAIEDHGQHDPALFATMDLPTLRAQELVQQGAIHALSTLLGHGCTEQTVRDMLASLRENARLIRAEASRRGVALFETDQLANPTSDDAVAGA